MRNLSALLLIVLLSGSSVFSQPDLKLRSDIRNTGYDHFPLPPDHSKSFETFGLTKKVLSITMLCDMETIAGWSHEGIGGIRLTSERSITGKGSLKIVAPAISDSLPKWGLAGQLPGKPGYWRKELGEIQQDTFLYLSRL